MVSERVGVSDADIKKKCTLSSRSSYKATLDTPLNNKSALLRKIPLAVGTKRDESVLSTEYHGSDVTTVRD